MSSSKKDWVAVIRGIMEYTGCQDLDVEKVRQVLIRTYPETNFSFFKESDFVELISIARNRKPEVNIIRNIRRINTNDAVYYELRIKHQREEVVATAVEQMTKYLSDTTLVAHDIYREGDYFVFSSTWKVPDGITPMLFASRTVGIITTINRFAKGWKISQRYPDKRLRCFRFSTKTVDSKKHLELLEEKYKDLIFSPNDLTDPTEYVVSFILTQENEKLLNDLFNGRTQDVN